MITGRPWFTSWGLSFRWRSQLSCTLCSIIPVDDNWIVQCGTVTQGPFMTKGRALRLAFAEAMTLRARGQRSRVSLRTGAVEFLQSTVCVPISKLHDVFAHRRLLHNASLDFDGARPYLNGNVCTA